VAVQPGAAGVNLDTLVHTLEASTTQKGESVELQQHKPKTAEDAEVLAEDAEST
jgi:hypothetical protein